MMNEGRRGERRGVSPTGFPGSGLHSSFIIHHSSFVLRRRADREQFPYTFSMSLIPPGVRAVYFDAVGTLLFPEPPARFLRPPPPPSFPPPPPPATPTSPSPAASAAAWTRTTCAAGSAGPS